MQVNLNPNKTSQSFTAIKLSSSAEQNLRKVLKPKDWVEFNDMIDYQATNPVDIYLFGLKDNLFYANIYPPDKYAGYMKVKQYRQWPFFESAIKFFNRIIKKADTTEKEINSMPEIDVDKILEKIRK